MCKLNSLKAITYFSAGKPIESSYYDTTYLIDVKGIPWTATKWEIIGFFEDFKILNGPDGIHFKVNNPSNNDAFIQLTTFTDYHSAVKQKTRYIGNSAIKCKSFAELPYNLTF